MAARLELTGRRIGQGLPTQCTICGGHLFEDASITGYAYRFPQEATLSVPRLYCAPCNREHIEFPTRGAHEVQFDCRLRKAADAYVLADVGILEYIAPTESVPTAHR